MNQSLFSNTTDSHEVEPRLVFENLPPDVQHRLFQLMAALTGADQLPEAQPQQRVPEVYSTSVPENIEAAVQRAHQAAQVQHAAAVTAMADNVVPFQKPERKMLATKPEELEALALVEEAHNWFNQQKNQTQQGRAA